MESPSKRSITMNVFRQAVLAILIFGMPSIILAAALQATDKAAAVQAELKKFEGTWSFVEMEIEGKPAPLDAFKDARLILKGSNFTLREPESTLNGTFTINPTANPKTIDVTFSDGPETGRTTLGIYSLEGDTYKVCMGIPSQPLPTTFKTEPYSPHVIQVLKCVKP